MLSSPSSPGSLIQTQPPAERGTVTNQRTHLLGDTQAPAELGGGVMSRSGSEGDLGQTRQWTLRPRQTTKLQMLPNSRRCWPVQADWHGMA